jgi:PAS domain S-box-containing protein
MEKKTDSLNNYIKREALYELKSKIVPGVTGHLCVIAILLFFTPHLKDHFWAMVGVSAGIILSSLLRIPFGLYTNEEIDANPRFWKTCTYTLLYLTLISWAGLFLITLSWYPFESLPVILIALVAAGNTANSTSSLSADPVLARIFSTVFMGAIVLGILIEGSSESYSVALLSFAHLTYHYVSIGMLAKAFRQGKERQYKLLLLQGESEQNRILLENIVNGLGEPVLLKTTDNIVQMINRSGEELFQVKAENLVGSSLDSILPPDLQTNVREIDRKVIETNAPYFDEITHRIDDKDLHIARRYFPYHDAKGSIIGILMVHRDITDLKEKEKSLLLARDELEHRVEERTRDLSMLSETLIVSQERLDSVLTGAPIILWAIDTKGVITHCEGSGLKSLGQDADFLTGKSIYQLFAGNSVTQSATRALSGESFKADGSIGDNYFESHWSCLRDEEGTIIGAACLTLDVGDRKRTEDALLQNTRLGDIVAMQQEIQTAGLDSQKIMDIVARRANDMTGADAASISSKEGDFIVGRAAIGFARNHLGIPLPLKGSFTSYVFDGMGTQMSGDCANDSRVNQQIAQSLNINSMIMVAVRHMGKTFGILAAFSHRKNAFDERQAKALELMGELLAASLSQAQDLEEKTRAIASLQLTERNLIKARAQAEAAAQVKADFLASMSHEIRTPLNGIIGMTELLIDSPLNEEQQRYARIVQGSGNGLLAIINDILDFSKIDAGKMEIEESNFDLVLLVETQAELLAVKAKDQKLSLMTYIDPAIPSHLIGDAGRIAQILLNLLSNAIKFTKEGGVTVRTRLLAMENNTATVRWEVVDSGIGISREVQDRLFTAFTQADGSTARRYGGTGLGLSISKRLVELMGGKIGIESLEGEGATFWFTLSLPIGEDSSPRMVDIDLSDRRILVVDDDPFACEVIGGYLRAWKADIAHVESGDAALRMLRAASDSERPYHLVMIDRRMEHMDGFELARHIKMDSRIDPCKLVLITAFDGPGQARAASDAKFNAFLTKPVKKLELRQAIGSLLKASVTMPDAVVEPATLNNILANSSQARILVVEDNSVNQLLAIQQLKKFGLECQLATNGREAWEAVKQADFDLILMDCQMPEMDGYEATVRIREHEMGTGRHVPIVAMTANAMREDEERCRLSGMDDFLAKPIKKDKLEAKLKLWLLEFKQSA